MPRVTAGLERVALAVLSGWRGTDSPRKGQYANHVNGADLTPDATILFASHSITEILGYQPDDIKGRSCFDYFHPEEIPFARAVHNRGVSLDKAAVLHYARIQAADGRWDSCECCFTVVHDVLVACTSIYRRGAKSERASSSRGN